MRLQSRLYAEAFRTQIAMKRKCPLVFVLMVFESRPILVLGGTFVTSKRVIITVGPHVMF